MSYYKNILILFCLIIAFQTTNAQDIDQKDFVEKVNDIRSKGCYCGHRYMPPVGKLKWNDLLYESALNQAKDMYDHHHFNHFSSEGLNIGQRLDRVGYDWELAGENLGEGQTTFDEAMEDWLKSKSHCRMIMNPKIKEIGIAFYKRFWVQHFGNPLFTNANNKLQKKI